MLDAGECFYARRGKRIFDIGFSGVVLLLTSPLLAAIAFAVWVTSPGPILFRQERVGKDGKLFTIFKFRTMKHDGENGPLVTSAKDSRVTLFGAWLRRTKLDELPQFWNVLVGDMSLVGPRPEVPKYVAFYTAEQRNSLRIRPGITSEVSIRFRNEEKILGSQPDPEAFYVQQLMGQKLEANKHYLNRLSFATDLAVLCRTAWASIVG